MTKWKGNAHVSADELNLSAAGWVVRRGQKISGNFEQHQRNIIGGPTVTPGGDSMENALFHFGQRQ
jgi:hypothetical protein